MLVKFYLYKGNRSGDGSPTIQYPDQIVSIAKSAVSYVRPWSGYTEIGLKGGSGFHLAHSYIETLRKLGMKPDAFPLPEDSTRFITLKEYIEETQLVTKGEMTQEEAERLCGVVVDA